MKLWKIMLAAMIAVLMIGAVAMADECNHQWSAPVRKQVGEMFTGTNGDHYAACVDEQVCASCNTTKRGEQYVGLIGSCTYGDPVEVDATCSTKGYTYKVCKVCFYVNKYAETDLAKHEVRVIERVAPTCMNPGYYIQGCLNCDWNHIWTPETWNGVENKKANCKTKEEVLVEATCSSKGQKAMVCQYCGHYALETVKEIAKDADAHDWKKTTVAATCTTKSFEIKDCKLCGKHAEDVVGEALGHHPDYSKETVVKPTCTTGGYSTAPCHRCNETVTYDWTSATHGTNKSYKDYKPATCSTAGYQAHYYCSACKTIWDHTGEVISAVPTIPANGKHILPQTGNTVVRPDCNATNNYIEGTCEVCGKTYVREYLPAAEHVYETKIANDTANLTVSKWATCTENGAGSLKCKNCPETKSVVIPAKGHTWGNWYYSAPANCTNDMVADRYCTECNSGLVVGAAGYEFKVIEAAKGHNWILEAGEEATCTKDGKGTRFCTGCEAKQYNVTIPATGHDFSKVVKVVAPTCTEKGYTVYTCKVCATGEEKGAYTEATGHQNFEVTATVAPKCGVAGSVTKACEDCGKTVTETVAALSHEYSWIVVSKPSEAGNGRNEYKCGKCGDVAEVKTIKYSKYYYNNTMTSFGPTTKELVGGNDWYRVTPVDVTVDGVYTYDLIASNKYVVGTVTISVNAGTLTVSYKVKGNVDVKDESLLIYASKADLAAGSAVTAPVGAAINVAETFGADGKVLVSLILTGDYDAAGKDLVNDAAAAGMIANID